MFSLRVSFGLRTLLGPIIIFGYSGALLAQVPDYEFQSSCPPSAELDTNFTDVVWAPAAGRKSFSSGNLFLQGKPKLDLKAGGFLLDGPAEELRLLTNLAPAPLSGICLNNLQAEPGHTVGTVTLTSIRTENGDIVYSNPDTNPCFGTPVGNPCTSTSPPIPIVKGSGDFLQFQPARLVEQLVFAVNGQKVGYTVRGLNLSQAGSVDCNTSDNPLSGSQCVNGSNGSSASQLLVVSTGELKAIVRNLDPALPFSTDLKIERGLTFLDSREECAEDQPPPTPDEIGNCSCSDAAYTRGCPRGLLLDFDAEMAAPRCNPPSVDKLKAGELAWVPPDWCGIEISDRTGKARRIVRGSVVDSDYVGYSQEDIESRIEFVVKDTAGAPPVCQVRPDDPRALWFYRSSNDASKTPEQEVPVLASLGAPPSRLIEMIDLTAGCNGLRSGRFSLPVWYIEPSRHYHDAHRVFNRLTQLTRTTLQQTLACTTNGQKVSTVASVVDKIDRWFQRADWTRTAMELNSFLDEMAESSTVAAMSGCYWDFSQAPAPGSPDTGDELIYNPVFKTPEEDALDNLTGNQFVPAGYTGLLKSFARAQQYQICSRFAPPLAGSPTRWSDPTLDQICACYLPENADTPPATCL